MEFTHLQRGGAVKRVRFFMKFYITFFLRVVKNVILGLAFISRNYKVIWIR